MNRIAQTLLLLLFAARPMTVGAAETTPREYRWQKTEHSLALVVAGRDADARQPNRIVWQYNYDKAEGKPYFHPLSLWGSHPLTDLRPADHRWHRAGWFSWKFINGVNYWEENRQGLSVGTTELVDIKVTAEDDYSARFQVDLSYHPPGKSAVLTERRQIQISAPDEKGQYDIDWSSTFTAGKEDVALGRTPIPGEPRGVAYGGYAGLSLRMAVVTRSWKFLDSKGRTSGKEIHGQSARWLNFGGKDPDGAETGIAIFDHPTNPRHPSPWYVAPEMPYFSPALLFQEPLTLKVGEELHLAYRILVHAGPGNQQTLDAEYKKFAKTQVQRERSQARAASPLETKP